MTPDGRATPYGGQDVTLHGCTPWVSDSCCGWGWPQDWDEKYAPTTKVPGTQGLGPPGMLVVMSANRFAWAALYMLNQITLNMSFRTRRETAA